MGVHKNTGVNRTSVYYFENGRIVRVVYMGVHTNTGVNRSIHGYT